MIDGIGKKLTNRFNLIPKLSIVFCARGILVLYMSSSFWLLGVESRDFSHTEKERTASKAEQFHKMTIIFTQNGPRLSKGLPCWQGRTFSLPS